MSHSCEYSSCFFTQVTPFNKQKENYLYRLILLETHFSPDAKQHKNGQAQRKQYVKEYFDKHTTNFCQILQSNRNNITNDKKRSERLMKKKRKTNSLTRKTKT